MAVKRAAVPRVAIVGILLAGSVLRIASSFAPGSLWYDELQTALNVTERQWGEIIEPLDYRQVAPLGFIAGVKAGTELLGPTEEALRLFPLIASIASLLLFWRVASRYLSGNPLLAALILFAMSPAFIWYARKAKQYSGDVAVTLILLLLALRILESRYGARRAWIAGVLGGLAIQFSHPAAFVACGLFLVLWLLRWRLWDPTLSLVPVGIAWGAGILIQILTTYMLVPPVTRSFMSRAWRFSFFPAPWSSPDALLWLPRKLFRFDGFILGLLKPDSPWEFGFVAVYLILALLGMWHLARRKREATALLLTPLAVAILVSAQRWIPLAGRLMIYVGPSLIVACIAGLSFFRARLPDRFGPMLRVAVIALAVTPAAFLPLVIPALNRQEDARPVLESVRQSWREGDVVYVFHGGIMAMRFYGRPLGLEPWIEGRRHGKDVRAHLREVDTLRGNPRAWFFNTHAAACQVQQIRAYLETIGTEVDRVDDPHGLQGMHESSARLYDLSDPELLSRSDADSFPLLDPGDPRCRVPDKAVGERIKRRLREFVGSLLG